MNNLSFLKNAEINSLPETPGVYLFQKGNKILYIGKASNLKERVKTHFQQPNYRDNLFINQTTKIGFIKTASEIEALVLEAKLIKKHQPKYNVIWKDNKNYFYVAFSKEAFPRIFITHQRKENAEYVGPFVDGNALKQSLRYLRKAFPYRSCYVLPKKPCLWHHLDRCLAPCSLDSQSAQEMPLAKTNLGKECQKNIRAIKQILQGQKVRVVKALRKEMIQLSRAEKFETAERVKNRIYSLEKVMAHSRVIKEASTPSIYNRIEAYDISNIQGQEATGSMVVFTEGEPDKKEYRKFKIKMAQKPNDTAMIREVLTRRLKHKEWPYPDLILIDGGKPQLGAARKVIAKIPVMALAKRNNELFLAGAKKPKLLKDMPPETANLILRLRDEAHRFALAYHHKLRKKSLLNS
jgi:excinuclease ABC subunit C